MTLLIGPDLSFSLADYRIQLILRLVPEPCVLVSGFNSPGYLICSVTKKNSNIVSVSDKDEDDDEQEKYEEINNEEVTHFDNVDDDKEEQWQETTEEDLPDVQDTKEIDQVKISTMVIASSLPRSPSKKMKTPSLEKALAVLIVTNTKSTIT